MNSLLEKEVHLIKVKLDELNFEDELVYGQWLAQTYYYVSHTVKFLSLCVSRFGVKENHLQQRFIKHIGEENRHELLALADLKVLNFDIQSFGELEETRCLYEPQYYKIEHLDPIHHLGYIIALESLAVHLGPYLIEKTKLHGSDKFLKLHSMEDLEHIKEAVALYDGLDKQRQTGVLQNLTQTFRAYSNLLESIRIESELNKKVA